MPRDNGDPPVRLYYRIGEVAELVGVEPHVLRYWESEFPTIRPQKSRSGQRVYSRKDVDKLLRVKDLLYAQRFTIAGARQRLRGVSSDPGLGQVEPVSHEEVVCGDASHQPGPLAVQPAVATTTGAGNAAADGVRAAATVLRSTLLTVREDLLGILEAIEMDRDPPKP